MFILTKKFRFEASHQLPNHVGKCRRLHGHSWQGYIEVTGPDLQLAGSEAGMLVDYGVLGKVVDEMVEQHLDHFHLNESLGLENPTSEQVARWVFKFVEGKLFETGSYCLTSVVIEETCTTKCEYRP